MKTNNSQNDDLSKMTDTEAELIPLDKLLDMAEISEEYFQEVIDDFNKSNPEYAGLLEAEIRN